VRHSMPEPNSGCWIWTGATAGGGDSNRPVLNITLAKYQSSKWIAARLAYFIEYGVFDEKLDVCHRCDNGFCVNPKHLFLGTSLDNNRDRHRKGRTVFLRQRGEQRYNAILTEADVHRIFELRAQGLSGPEMAKQYDLPRQTIANVLYGRAWHHITQSYSVPTAIRRNQKVAGSERDRLLKLRQTGWSYTKLAKEFNLSVSGVQSLLNREKRRLIAEGDSDM